MFFSAPIWLSLLAPWIGGVVWVLLGKPGWKYVPFVQLWDHTPAQPAPQRELRKPPIEVILVLLAILLTIFAAAGTTVRSLLHAQPVRLIVDRGVSMSNPDRYGQTIARALAALNLSGQPIEVQLVPGPLLQNDTVDASTFVKSYLPTGIDTSDILPQAVREASAQFSGKILVVTDHPLAIQDPRIIPFYPDKQLANAGIEMVGVRELPSPQVMVRVFNGTSQTQTTLRISSGRSTLTLPIQLPKFGAMQDYFVELNRLDRVVQASIDIADDIEADNTAWTLRQRTWPKIEARSVLPDALLRLIDIYQTQRPAGESSRCITVSQGFFQMPRDLPGVGIAPSQAGQKLNGVSVRIDFDHPILKDVDWRKCVIGATAYASPGNDWQTLVSQGDLVLVAAREQPIRQVWVGFDQPNWSSRADYVVFWSNVFDWLGEGSSDFTSFPAEMLGDGWTRLVPEKTTMNEPPGVYQRKTDGFLRAQNSKAVHPTTLPASTTIPAGVLSVPAVVSASPYLLMLAMILAVVGLLKWIGRR